MAAALLFASGAVCTAQTTWIAGSTVTINTTFTVTDTLTIEPGVTVRMRLDAAFVIGPTGTLVVNGTPADPVRFTAQGFPWPGMRFEPGSHGDISGAIIEECYRTGIEIIDASPVIQHSTIRGIGRPENYTNLDVAAVRVRGADAHPVIALCTIEGVVGSRGASGPWGQFGSNGAAGADGTTISPDGQNGAPGANGGAGGTGAQGLPAYGVRVSDGARAIIAYNTIRDIVGGRGGPGGFGGNGGRGGEGGQGLTGFARGGNGGNGGRGGAGGAAGEGGLGGFAAAISLESASGEVSVYQNLISGVESGPGGVGGNKGDGGNGGHAGPAGHCYSPFCTAGNGGNGGNGGNAGSTGGTGGASGSTAALHAIDSPHLVSFLNNTVADLRAGAPGGGGLGGVGGLPGNRSTGGNASGSGTNGTNGSNGTAGAGSSPAGPGLPGTPSGAIASGADTRVEMYNNIAALFGGAGVMLRSQAGALITADYNNFFGHASLFDGTILLGVHNVMADPLFAAPQSGDYRLSTAASPGVDSGSNARLPRDILDLNNNADTSEPIPFDLAGNPRVVDGDMDGVATVDMGAFEGFVGVIELQVFRSAAHFWRAAAPSEAYAFDEFFPGVASGGGCLVGDPSQPVVLQLGDGTLTVSAFRGTTPVCAVTDGSGAPAVSDANLDNSTANGRVVFEFDPPVTGFYTYFGSIAVGHTVSMDLYADDGAGLAFLQSIVSSPSAHAVEAAGLGFRSPDPVRRIEFTTSEVGQALIGAFTGLRPEEPSLGTIEIDGYSGPNGSTVEFDFACTFVARPSCAPDVTGDGVVNFADLNSVLSSFGQTGDDLPADTNADGVVNFADLNTVLGAFGTVCPS